MPTEVRAWTSISVTEVTQIHISTSNMNAVHRKQSVSKFNGHTMQLLTSKQQHTSKPSYITSTQ